MHLSTSLNVSEQAGDEWSAAWARELLSEIEYESGKSGNNSGPFLANLAVFERIGDQRGSSRVLNYLGMIAMAQESYAEAQDYFEQLLANVEKIGDIWGEAGGYNKLGQLAAVRGDYDQAWGFLQRALQLLQKTGDQRRIAYLQAELGELCAVSGSDQEAEEFFRRSLELARLTQNLALIQHILTCRAASLLKCQQPGLAAGLLRLVISAPMSDQSTSWRAAMLLGRLQPEDQKSMAATAVGLPAVEGLPTAEQLWQAARLILDKNERRNFLA
ncbi:MAG: tetratricopeptide repeat protein [Anaerolineaceae bacterium]|nr:tetratricopeptide repeat protein [Anaerolineaceae bacterium]